jgi:hypothetical protein
MPREIAAWAMLERLFSPAIALFSRYPQARAWAAPLRAELMPFADLSNASHWLCRMMSILDNEPYVAIEPSTNQGIIGRMSGVSENFQLHVLLMDVFPLPPHAPRRVSTEAAAIARGEGPQQSPAAINGHWNLYTYHALSASGTLPDPKDYASSKTWIWGEGIPADIPTLDGHRIILLGPPSYARGFGSQRDFAALRASLNIDHRLSAAELGKWISSIKDANAKLRER